ncbi:MAG: OmpP1/FadL family transporter, partial [Bdellovibrionales bacterium]
MFKMFLCLVTIAMGLAIHFTANAAGLEKSTLWSGHYMGIGGAAASSVAGSEALYFNPAGLGNGSSSKDLSLNLSPTNIAYGAPNVSANTNETSNRIATPVTLLYSQRFNEKWALGAGTYTAGGTDVVYSNIDTGVRGVKALSQTIVAIQEVSVGLAYKVNDQWKVGAAWRGGFVQADMAGVAAGNLTNLIPGDEVLNLEYRNMKGSNMYGYRLGVQYTPSETWGLGMMYRSDLGVVANGKTGGFFHSALGTTYFPEDDMSVKTGLPQALSLGTHYKASDTWMLFAEGTWTNYGQNEKLDFEGSYNNGGAVTSLSDQPLNWKDQYNLRLAGEYTGWKMPLRTAYVYTSQVTPEHRATTTLAPPAPAHTLAVGTGIKCMDDALSIDGTIEKTLIKADLTGSGTLGVDLVRQGSYSADVTAL